ncbi:MTH1187 family thiamine-binding protein [Salipaludibacillus daqingensis]|uniref:MTH1187 family thiamine-binding protein n=1 Tax=Salipaludibacillus daqingensis TaxID=3041001 RepID=UPI002475CDC7|nr:MTH1187 family thiamine-binding protein [Salipaludibacillus daqingensis]
MVKGLSYQKGIMFIGRKHVAFSYVDKGKPITWIKPITPLTMFDVGKLVFTSMPLWFHIFLYTWILLIIYPYILQGFGLAGAVGLPMFTLIYFLFGTHFWFPTELKKFHGAEHKVFSFRGIVSARNREKIQKAEITNRYCSTNGIMLYFLILIIMAGFGLLLSSHSFLTILEIATYGSLLVWPITVYWLHRTKMTIVHEIVLSLSYWLQRRVTTLEPEEIHLKTAIQTYRKLAFKEFPQKIIMKKKKKEVAFMAIADVTIMPLGSDSTSVSDVVAEVHKTLKRTKLPIHYELTSMSTLIEGEIDDIYAILKVIQEVPFKLGHKRVATNIRIDDRRDKPSSIKGKLSSVQMKMEEN